MGGDEAVAVKGKGKVPKKVDNYYGSSRQEEGENSIEEGPIEEKKPQKNHKGKSIDQTKAIE